MPLIPTSTVVGNPISVRELGELINRVQRGETTPVQEMQSNLSKKPVVRLTTIKDAQTISNEGELVGRLVVITKAPCVGLQGKIVKVVTAERISEESKTKGHRDVFYTVETDERYVTGLMWQDFLQLPRP